MKRQLCMTFLCFGTVLCFASLPRASAQHAVEVRSYSTGTTPAIDFVSLLPYDLTSSALGAPSRFTDDIDFPSVVSPFSGPYKRNQLLSVGESGHVTLRLSNYALPQLGGNEIGIFGHASLADFAFPAGQAGSPAAAFSVDSAFVEMSADGITWLAAGIGDTTFDIPTNGYNDVTDPFDDSPGGVPSDFRKPFAGTLSSFDGLRHHDDVAFDILELLDGSGGGKWLDIPLGLMQVGFIRFGVADDGNPNVGLNFEFDAVSIARGAMGAPTVPEPASIGLLTAAIAIGILRLRRIRCCAAT